MLNPKIFRDAAARLERIAALGYVSVPAIACCPAISDVGVAAGVGRAERGVYHAFFQEWFAPEDAEPDECWWISGDLMPRLIALDLAAEICEDEAAAVQARIDAINLKLTEVLVDYIGAASTERALKIAEDQLCKILLEATPKWLKLMVNPSARDQIIPANLPTLLVLAGYSNPEHPGHMDLEELGFLERFRTCTTPDGCRWNYDPEQGDATVAPPAPLNTVNVTLDVQKTEPTPPRAD